MTTTTKGDTESDTAEKRIGKQGVDVYMTVLYVSGEVKEYITILDVLLRNYLLAFIWKHSHDILTLEEVYEVYQEIMLRVAIKVGNPDDMEHSDSWRRLTFGIARNTTRETLRKRGNDLKFIRPEFDDFYTTTDSDAKRSEMQKEIALAFSNSGLTDTEKVVMKTYADNIDDFNDRDVYKHLTELLEEKYHPDGLPEELATERRLKTVWLSARRKLRDYLVVRGYTYQRKHDGERNAKPGTL